jgi:dTDP-4-dehydrorhamnose reductase
MSKFLVTGSSTMLGKAIIDSFSQSNDVFAPSQREMNIISEQECYEKITKYKPDVVIHCAEMSDIEECENKPVLAQLANVNGAFNVAMASKAIGSSMVLISTDHVFDGTKANPYNIYDRVNPLNVYGKTKVIAEELIASTFDNYHIVRLGYVFGEGNNLVNDILTSKRNHFECSAQHFLSPVYVKDVVIELNRIIYAQYGIYHISNCGFASEYQLAKEVVNIADLVKEIRAVQKPSFVPVSTYRVMSSTLRHWRVALKDYIEEIKPAIIN